MSAHAYTRAFIVLLAGSLPFTATARAQVDPIHVDAAATGQNNGETWDDAYTDLQTALQNAESGDVIYVAGGTYRTYEADPAENRGASFVIGPSVSLEGGYAGHANPSDPYERDIELYETILSGDQKGDDGPDFTNRTDNSYHVVIVSTDTPGNTMLDGFTISGGYADSTDDRERTRGAGLYAADFAWEYNKGVQITDCTFTDNMAHYYLSGVDYDNVGGTGGGLYAHEFAVELVGCTFRGNVAEVVGGGMSSEHSYIQLTECVFEDNLTQEDPTLGGGFCGGGLSASGNWEMGLSETKNNTFVTNCVFTGNHAEGAGGGISAGWHRPHITGCTFTGNTSGYLGGALEIGDGLNDDPNSVPARVSFCDFADNTADSSAGAFQLEGTATEIIGCRFVHNRAGLEDDAETYSGGAISMSWCADPDYRFRVWLVNCEFAGNGVEPGGARMGGGLAADKCDASLVNCLFVGNEAEDVGGGLYVRGTSLGDDNKESSLVNCTFVANCAAAGNAIYDESSDLNLFNSIVWQDSGSSDPVIEVIWLGDPTVDIEYCNVQGGWSGTGNIDSDPLFVRDPYDGGDGWGNDPETPEVDEGANDDFGDLHLLLSSPCVDAGNNDVVPADEFDVDRDENVEEPTPDLERDWDLNDRIQLCAVDMGAYEGLRCVGDLNQDGDTDLADLAQLLGHYGAISGMTYADGDLDCDGDVDLTDLGELLSAYGCVAGDGERDGASERADGPNCVAVSMVAHDTGGYSGGGFEGEVDHFVFDLKIEVDDPNNDDWVVTGAVLEASNQATFRLSTMSTTPDEYATFVAAPWSVVPGSATANLAGAYEPADPLEVFTATNINLGWWDLAESEDGPATVMRIVIDVSQVAKADVSGGFGSVYFSNNGPAKRTDILVAGFTSGIYTAQLVPDVESLSGEFYVKKKKGKR
jgi:hypothetical protein